MKTQKHNPMKLASAAFAVAAGTTLLADVPEVSSVVMSQAADRQVTITYTLADAPAVITLDVQTNADTNAAADDPGWTSIGGSAVQNASGDVWKKVGASLTEGNSVSGTIAWRPDHSWPDHKIPANGARAVVTAWALDNTPDYMAVDLSATGGADTQTYYPAADFVPGGDTNILYKTTMLLMRKIMAKNVRWTMGSVDETGRNAERETTHQVTLTNNYYIGVYPVTQGQWTLIAGYNPSFFTFEGTMRPVEKVAYTDIRQGVGTVSTAASASGGVWPNSPYETSFLGLLRNKTELDFDLPSEAQWEFAARAGNGNGYWGNGSPMLISSDGKDANLDVLGRYLTNPASNSSDGLPETTAPSEGGTAIVGSYARNAWGLFDTNGNVYEYCLDWFKSDITGLNGAVNTTQSDSYRVWRGGSWNFRAGDSRPAYRSRNLTGDRAKWGGLRVVCTGGLK